MLERVAAMATVLTLLVGASAILDDAPPSPPREAPGSRDEGEAPRLRAPAAGEARGEGDDDAQKERSAKGKAKHGEARGEHDEKEDRKEGKHKPRKAQLRAP